MNGSSPVGMRNLFDDDAEMQDIGSNDVPTPKPLKKTVDDIADIGDSESETDGDDEFETPRALKMKSQTSRVVILTDESEDALEYQAKKKSDTESNSDSPSLDDLQQMIQMIKKKGEQPKKDAGGKKGKRPKMAFRTEVQEARAIIANQESNNKKSKVTCILILNLITYIVLDLDIV